MKKHLIFLICSLTLTDLFGARLPKNLSGTELNQLIRTLAFGNTTKLMRSAEAYPVFPGTKISLETTFVHSGDLTSMGDGTASLPAVIPSPRLNITKGLGLGLEATLSLSSQQLLQTMATVGFLGKWTFADEKDEFATSALFASFSSLSGFNDTFRGSDFEIGVTASKDFVRLKPYLGLGLLLASGTVPKSICAITQHDTVVSPHLFFGTEVELPMNVAFQIDFTNWIPSGSLALGYRF